MHRRAVWPEAECQPRNPAIRAICVVWCGAMTEKPMYSVRCIGSLVQRAHCWGGVCVCVVV